MKVSYPLSLILALVIGIGAGWAMGSKKFGHGSPAAAGPLFGAIISNPTRPIIELDGKPLTSADLPASLQATIAEDQRAVSVRISRSLEEFALRLSLARVKDPQIKASLLPPLEELMTVTPPTDEEVKIYFDANKSRLAPNVKLDQVKMQLRDYLLRQKVAEAATTSIKEMQSSGRLRILN